MSIFNLGKLRIGTKLGLSAGVGVVLVVGMIASGQMQNVGREQAAAEIKSSYELRGAIAAFELTTRRLLIANRDMRLAINGKQIEDAVGADQRPWRRTGRSSSRRSPSSAPSPRPRSRSTACANSTAAMSPV